MSGINRRQFVTLSASALCSLGLVACGGNNDKKQGESDSANGSVYFLNFKPEADQQWKDLAAKYTEETKVPVKVVTAASDTYAQTFQSEINKDASVAPTLFQTNGPSGLIGVKDYCVDLKGAKILDELTNDALKLQEDGVVYGVDYVEEDYGIIYNKKLLEKAGYKGDDIKDFASLKKVVEDALTNFVSVNVEKTVLSTVTLLTRSLAVSNSAALVARESLFGSNSTWTRIGPKASEASAKVTSELSEPSIAIKAPLNPDFTV